MLGTAETHLPFARSMIYLFIVSFDTRLRSIRAHFKSWKSSCGLCTTVIREPCATMNRQIKFHGEMRVPIIDFMVHLLWIATFPFLRQWLQIRYRMCRQTTQIRQITVHKCDFPKQKSNWLSVCRKQRQLYNTRSQQCKICFFCDTKKKETMTRSGSQENAVFLTHPTTGHTLRTWVWQKWNRSSKDKVLTITWTANEQHLNDFQGLLSTWWTISPLFHNLVK